ncbi:WD repeat and HMG-box DNA-binding protein 1 [Rhynchospora pubera]|uniref:WD repeat and HMG-box DNA-binding protein 1 n=1 Tax=Rhynchospora pubera TaxID=906938 RepID=A0AAV8D3P5_9POAL|nr:WD repeat and HMG-box DNA-binding protein 1 [Rhynchospora pubera]
MGRLLKLREAHKTDAPATCSVLWAHDGSHLATSCASDTEVLIHDLSAPPPGRSGSTAGSSPVVLRHHKEGVTAIALGPTAGPLASGSFDHSVKLYNFPVGSFQGNVTRFTLPIKSLAFNKSGSLLAAAGDDDGIKLISTIDLTISRVLKGHRGPVTGLSFDPKHDYLASIDSFGTVIYWELSTGKQLHTLKSIAPNYNSDSSVLNTLSWRPDGEMLAVPGLRNDVVMYDRDTGEKLFNLRGDHEKSVCSFCWSPNGKYLATSGLDKQVLIWDVDLKQDIERQKFEERICGLSWKPVGNSLAVIDVVGRFGIWDNPVPVSMKSPTEGVVLNEPHSLFEDEDEEEVLGKGISCYSGSLDDSIEKGSGDFSPISRKRVKKRGPSFDEGEEVLQEIDSRKRRKESENKRGDGEIRERAVRMQDAFQVGFTPPQQGKRRFLCYNLLGCVTSLENDGFSHVEVDFHDTGRGPRVPSMTDYFGFTMAALNEKGCVLANPCKGEKNMSTLMYRPFGSWANNSEWSMRFELEEVKVVALGKNWVAAVTSHNFLRIFTESGLQMHILSVNGPVVAAAGSGDLLAVVTHASDCLSSGDQVLEIKVFNINEATQTISGRLPLTPCSHLTWLGFSEDGRLGSFDSKGNLRVYSDQFGGSWLPVFSADKARKSEDENYWIVGFNATKLFCIVCKSPESYPSVMPKPVLTILEFSSPLASSDLGADEVENEFMMTNLQLSEIRKKIKDMEAFGLDVTALDDEAFSLEVKLDRCILKLIASCCHSDRLVRATELARLLSTQKSLKGAITIVTASKLPILQEKFSTILEERMLDDLKTPEPIPTGRSNGKTAYSVQPPVRLSPMMEKSPDLNNRTPNTIKPQIKSSPATETLKLVKARYSTPENLAQGEDISKERELGSKLEKLATFVKGKGNATSEVTGKDVSSSATGNVKPELKFPINPFARVKKAT